jgi:hypothetical protein
MMSRLERWDLMDRAVAGVLSTITDADWRAMFRRHRAGEPNRVSEQLKKILNPPPGLFEPEDRGKLSTDL